MEYHSRLSSQATFVVLSIFLVLASAACSTNNNNGNCDAQGAQNPVSCTEPGKGTSRGTSPGARNSPSSVRSKSAPSGGSAPQPESTVPVLAPAEQSGWVLDWHQHVSIEPQGVIVTRAGPVAGNGSNFDIQYVPGHGWSVNNDTQEMDNWPSTIQPGPATINGFIMAGDANSAPQGNVAHVGDTIDWISQNNDLIGYIDVVSVNASGVEVDMWVWTKE
jgi:hypothetical protein